MGPKPSLRPLEQCLTYEWQWNSTKLLFHVLKQSMSGREYIWWVWVPIKSGDMLVFCKKLASDLKLNYLTGKLCLFEPIYNIIGEKNISSSNCTSFSKVNWTSKQYKMLPLQE